MGLYQDFTAWCRDNNHNPNAEGLYERFCTFDWYYGAARWEFPISTTHVVCDGTLRP